MPNIAAEQEPSEKDRIDSVPEAGPTRPPNGEAAYGNLIATIGNQGVLRLLQRKPASPELDQATSHLDDQNLLPLQSSYGNSAVARTLIQRKAEGEEVSGAAGATSTTPAVAAATPTQPLLVEDNVETVAPGQMKKSEFLSQLRGAVANTVAKALTNNPLSVAATPYLNRVFAQYAAQDSGRLERSIRRYAPETASATNAGDLIPVVTGRVRRSLTTWVRTGEVSGLPEGLPLDLPGLGSAGGVTGGVADVASSVASGIGSAASAVGSLLFKGRDGGAHQGGDPETIQSELGGGQSLDAGVRTRMESAFGENFGDVQIHADTNAAGVSEDLSARAFTVGKHIAFGTGEYKPGSLIGDALIAHELAHVLQQRGGAAAGSAQKGTVGYGALEEDADDAAVGAVVSSWGGAKSGLARIAKRALPSFKSGLRLQRCDRVSSGPIGPSRLTSARTNFRTKNSHLSADELARIEAAITAVSADNINLQITFYDYYSSHSITKMDAATAAAAMRSSLYATTRPNSDTVVRPDIIGPGFPPARLGSLLIHELTHTRHDTNFMGTRDYQEGESYGVEYYLAERAGERTRMTEILSVMSNSLGLTMPIGVPALQLGFRSQYATMYGLYEIIDTGRSSQAGSPFVTPTPLTAAEARALAAELVATRESNHSTRLASILTWVKANLARFPSIPPI